MATTQTPARVTATLASGDVLRQTANVFFAIAQIVSIVWTFQVNESFSFRELPAYEPPVIPAAYTFAVWFVIYAGALGYALYQALPSQRDCPLLRRIGWWTAGAFAAATAWAIPAGLGWPWPTVALIFTMFGTLLAAFIGFSRERAPRTPTERLIIVAPLSVYIGYVTIATVANTASAFAQSGVSDLAGLSTTAWAVLMLAVAGLIASGVIRWSRGNVAYALTIIWALVGITVANVSERPNVVVALTAGSVAAFVALALLATRLLVPARASRRGGA